MVKSLAESVTWRCVATAELFVVSFITTLELHSAGSIAGIAAITSTAHFVHERVWHKEHYRFGMELPRRFTLGFLRRVFVEKFSADRYRRLVAGRRFDALLPDEAIGKALHRRRRRTRPVAVDDCGTKQGRSAGAAAFSCACR
jgi:uncharacterized membrane protein